MSSHEIRRTARAMRSHSARAVGAFGAPAPKLAIVRSVSPLTAEMTDHRLTLDEDDLLLTQSVRRYKRDVGLVAGDTLVLLRISTDDYVVIGVLSQTDVKAGAATTTVSAGGAEFASGVDVTSEPIVALVPYYDADGTLVGHIPLIA